MKIKKSVRIISMILCIFMLSTMLSSCNTENIKEGESEKETNSVAYNSDGNFTTTMTVKDAKFAEDITASDLSAWYYEFDNIGYQAALAVEGDVEESSINPDDYNLKRVVSVENATRKEANTLEISIHDGITEKTLNYEYYISVPKAKSGTKEDVIAVVTIEYPDYNVTTNLESVSVYDEDIRLTLTLNGGVFIDNVKPEDIILSGSFANMEIDSISSAGKNLTIQLVGEMAMHASSNAYLDGGVIVAKTAIQNGYKEVSALIPVETLAAGFVLEDMAISNDTVTVPVRLRGLSFDSEITNKDFLVDGATVTNITVTDSSNAIISMIVENAGDKNSAAAAIDGKAMTLFGSETVTADFADASFYPVFDYVEEKNGNLEFTLVLYSDAGTFADTLNTDSVSFGSGFAGASIVSLTRDNDTTATLVISVPANGATTEALDLSGTVILAGGMLVNLWGDTKTDDCKYTRNYSQESMGKNDAFTSTLLTADDISAAVDGVINTPFSYIGSAASAASAVYTVLELTGIVESEKVKLNDIRAKVEAIQASLSEQSLALARIETSQIEDQVQQFDSKINDMISLINDATGYYRNAETYAERINIGVEKPKDISNTQFHEDVILEFMKNSKASRFIVVWNCRVKIDGKEYPLPKEFYLEYEKNKHINTNKWGTIKMWEGCEETFNKIFEPARGKGSEDDWIAYNTALLAAMYRADELKDENFIGFEETMKELEKAFISITNELKLTNDSNPLRKYDYLCTITFNFDRSSVGARKLYRARISYALDAALNMICAYRNSIKYPNNEILVNRFNDYHEAKAQMEANPVPNLEYNDSVYCYLVGKKVSEQLKCIFYFDIYMDNDLELHDEKQQQFLARMQGRTLKQELELAKLYYLSDKGEKITDISALTLDMWREVKWFGPAKRNQGKSKAVNKEGTDFETFYSWYWGINSLKGIRTYVFQKVG